MFSVLTNTYIYNIHEASRTVYHSFKPHLEKLGLHIAHYRPPRDSNSDYEINMVKQIKQVPPLYSIHPKVVDT